MNNFRSFFQSIVESIDAYQGYISQLGQKQVKKPPRNYGKVKEFLFKKVF